MAWLGDAAFELDVRQRLCSRGDYPTDRLDAMKADIVCARCQAELLTHLEPHLDEDEAAIVRRGRNTSIGRKSGGRTDVRTHRSATGFEALLGHWLELDDGRARYDALLLPHLERVIDAAVTRRATKLRRG